MRLNKFLNNKYKINMKRIKILTISLITINIGLLKAQTNQGRVLLGVSSELSIAGTGTNLLNIGYSSINYKSDADGFEESDPDKTTGINFLPKVGYFVADNLAVGLDLNVALFSRKYGTNNDKFSETLLSAGPFVRYYVPTSTILPYFEIGGSLGTMNSKYDYSEDSNWEDDEYKSSVMSIGGGIGLASSLGEHVMLDILAGYNSLTLKEKRITMIMIGLLLVL